MNNCQFACRALPALAILAPLLGACAGGTPPTAQLAVAGSTLSDAEQAGAVQYAPTELNQARQKLAAAHAAAREEDYERAERLAAEAKVTAELAEVKTRAGLAQQSAAAVRRGADALRREAAPSVPPGSASSPLAPSQPATR